LKDLTKLARGQDCEIRVPGICLEHNETVVLCHLRMSGISGYGLKAADALGAYGCQACHDFVDGRSHKDAPAEYRRSLLLEGVARTLNKLITKGIIRW
jgi:hypothetical protein